VTHPQIGDAEVRTERMATGGEAVARLDDGRVVFVQGALPDETVRIELTQQKKRFARGAAVEIVDASPHRVDPGCSHIVSGDCGGCDWMHIAHESQIEYKHGIVVEQLERLGGVDASVVMSTNQVRGRRTTVRCVVVDGRAGYHRRRSDRSFAAESCEAAHPLLEELLVSGRFGNATEVTLRVGAATGEQLVLTNGDPTAVKVAAAVTVAALDAPGDAGIHEIVAGQMWRISARSFFQTSLEGAEALVGAVERALQGAAGPVVDLYAGVGLLGGAAAADRLTMAVESNASSIADARHNLQSSVAVEQARVERWSPLPFGAVIADPARRGLGQDGVAVIDATGASVLALVSCDPAALGRDTALLHERGWRYERGEVIDMFPDTSRIEVVSTFRR